MKDLIEKSIVLQIQTAPSPLPHGSSCCQACVESETEGREMDILIWKIHIF